MSVGRPRNRSRRWPRWRVAPNCSSSPSSACSTRARCTGTSCASGSTPRSGRSARCPTAPSTRRCATCSTRAWIAEAPQATGGSGSRRARIVYELTHTGKERFQELVDQAGPSAWEDDEFAVHLAFFARTTHEVRLRILEGRRSRLEERLAQIREASVRNRERLDAYTTALQRHGEEQAEREVRWLEELITTERNTPHT